MRRLSSLAVSLLAAVLALPGPGEGFPLNTNLEKALVPLEEIRPGGPPPDGIPPIDTPRFVTVQDAEGWLKAREPVVAVEVNGDARAYPIQILMWHEIVNDTIGGVPVTVTFCPLCNTAIAFDRRVGGKVYDFGTSGMLYHSDLVMYDRATHSLWAQMLGQAIVGDLAGTRLKVLPATIVSWADWKKASPTAKVLSRDTGHRRPYGDNPYVGYDRVDQPPFLFQGKLDGRLPPMERVVALLGDAPPRAYPYPLLRDRRVIADRAGSLDLVIFHQDGTASALDQETIASSREVGATGVFSPLVDGRRLTFGFRDGAFVDQETGSRWTILGRAVSGPLAGKRLTPLPHVDTFWFAWAAFQPQASLYPGK